jgi:hypothetical protein
MMSSQGSLSGLIPAGPGLQAQAKVCTTAGIILVVTTIVKRHIYGL